MMEEQEKTIQDYLGMLSRRKFPMFFTVAGVFLLGVIIALVWPPTYRSKATILIKEQDIPTDLVRSTVTSYAAQQIQTISQRVMTRSNLLQIIEKYDLYKKERDSMTTEEIIDEMRDDIKLNMIDADVVDPRTGRPTTATIAFSLSYDGDAPESTQKVAGELTTLFLNENLKTRKEKASETYNFLTEESNKLKKKIQLLETEMADFKDKHADSLPEMRQLNLSLLDRTQREQDTLESELRSRNERKFYLESQLEQTNPLTNMRSETGVTILDPASRLKALEAQYASLTAKYSPEHPDVIKMKREIDGLRAQVGSVNDSVEKARQLSQARADLATLKKKYAPDHPDVIQQEKKVAALENALKKLEKLPETNVMEQRPDNPAYIALKSQLQTVNAEIDSLKEQQARAKAKVADLEKRLAKSPQVEKQFNDLKREHDNTVARYQDIRARQMEADIGQQMEKESKGESFQLIDPAQYPEEPVKPNRIAIVFLAMVFSVACGLGFVFLAEALDSSVRGINGVTAMLTSVPLAVIPHIYTPRDFYKKKRTNRLILGSTIAVFVLVLLGIHFFYSPLDVLWFRGVRKAENIIGL